VRKPLLTKARAAAVVSPRRSHALDASQYSSNDEALRLMVIDKLHSLEADAVLPANYLAAEWPIRDIARTHEAVVNVAPDAAIPVAASPPSYPQHWRHYFSHGHTEDRSDARARFACRSGS
jgi:hypothetical protein